MLKLLNLVFLIVHISAFRNYLTNINSKSFCTSSTLFHKKNNNDNTEYISLDDLKQFWINNGLDQEQFVEKDAMNMYMQYNLFTTNAIDSDEDFGDELYDFIIEDDENDIERLRYYVAKD